MFQMKRFNKILFVVDPKRSCKAALEWASLLAENNQAELTLVDVMPSLGRGLQLEGSVSAAELQATVLTQRKAQRKARLESLVEPFRQQLAIQTKVLVGTPHLEIIREVLRGGHDLVVRPPENPGWLDRLFGSDDMNLLRECPCPVWLTKCKGSHSLKRILAAVDVDDIEPSVDETRHALSRRILEIAGALALTEFAELHVVHVWDAAGEALVRGANVGRSEARVAAYVEQVKERGAANLATLLQEVTELLGADALAYLKPTTHLVRGSARKKIPALAKRLGVELIVMGTVARTGIPGLLMGNTAETILQQVDCSVLTIKPPGFVTPVTLES